MNNRYNEETEEYLIARDIIQTAERHQEELTKRGFSFDFITSIQDFMLERKFISEKQYNALVKIQETWLDNLNDDMDDHHIRGRD